MGYYERNACLQGRSSGGSLHHYHEDYILNSCAVRVSRRDGARKECVQTNQFRRKRHGHHLQVSVMFCELLHHTIEPAVPRHTIVHDQSASNCPYIAGHPTPVDWQQPAVTHRKNLRHSTFVSKNSTHEDITQKFLTELIAGVAWHENGSKCIFNEIMSMSKKHSPALGSVSRRCATQKILHPC